MQLHKPSMQIAKFYTPETEMVYFGAIGVISIILGIILILLVPKVQRNMQGIR